MDLLHGLLYFLLITFLGLLIAFSPMIVIVNLIVVLKSKRPILRTFVLMAGMVAPLLIVAGLAILFLDPNSQISLRAINEKINIPPLIDLALGGWLVALGFRRWRYSQLHNGPKKSVNMIMKQPPDKLGGLFSFAFIKSALSVTNLFAVLLVCKLVITQSVRQPLAIAAILWAILIGLIPFVAILYLYFFKHERLDVLSNQVDKLLNRNLDVFINLALALVGGGFVVHGLLGLLSH